eukprot:jgi/Mesvir1/19930/Mv13198-RA.1
MESASPSAASSAPLLGSRRRRKSNMTRVLIVMPALFLSTFPIMLVLPSMPDVVVHALCDGNPRCSLALYVTGVSSMFSGLLSIFLCVYAGSLSDTYGRKPFLALSIALQALPYAVLIAGITRTTVWTYLALHLVMTPFGSVMMTVLYAYVADVSAGPVKDSAFSFALVPFGVSAIFGPALGRMLPMDYVFRVGAALSLIAVLWVVLVVPESLHSKNNQAASSSSQNEPSSPVEEEGAPFFFVAEARSTAQDYGGGDADIRGADIPRLVRHQSSLKAGTALVRRSSYLKLLAIITFIVTFAEAGLVASLSFYLKARFGFRKAEFGVLYLVSGTSIVAVQLVGMPIFTYLMSTRNVLTFSLLLNAIHCYLYGAAWAPYVAFVAVGLGSFAALFFPTVGALTARGGTREEQGLLQGVMSGVRSLANGIGPLLSNTLTGYFISDAAPFDCPGIAFYVAALLVAAAGVMSLWIPRNPPTLQPVLS